MALTPEEIVGMTEAVGAVQRGVGKGVSQRLTFEQYISRRGKRDLTTGITSEQAEELNLVAIGTFKDGTIRYGKPKAKGIPDWARNASAISKSIASNIKELELQEKIIAPYVGKLRKKMSEDEITEVQRRGNIRFIIKGLRMRKANVLKKARKRSPKEFEEFRDFTDTGELVTKETITRTEYNLLKELFSDEEIKKKYIIRGQ